MTTMRTMQAAGEVTAEQYATHLAMAREEGYLKAAPAEPCAWTMNKVISILEGIEKESPGALAMRPPKVVASLRVIATACRAVIRKEEGALSHRLRLQGTFNARGGRA